MRPRISEILVADAPREWEAIGFAVQDRLAWIDGVALRLGGQGDGITGWRLGPWPDPDPHEGPAHPNGVTGIDHLVLVTEDWTFTVAELCREGIELSRERRTTEVRQGFVRLGRVILELVERPGHHDPPGFWGLTFVVRDPRRSRIASVSGSVPRARRYSPGGGSRHCETKRGSHPRWPSSRPRSRELPLNGQPYAT